MEKCAANSPVDVKTHTLSKNIEQVKALGHGEAVTFCAKTSTKTANFTMPVFEAL
jgi:hypothetical protein